MAMRRAIGEMDLEELVKLLGWYKERIRYVEFLIKEKEVH